MSGRRVARIDGRAFTLTVGILAALCAVPIAVLVFLAGAPSLIVLALVLAAVPVGPLVAVYLWLDRYEPEPRVLLALGLAWGGCVATVGSLVLGGIGGFFTPISAAQSATVVAPITEEFCKGAFLVLLLVWRRAELDGVLDGIVYAGMVGIGFAFLENVLYLTAAYNGTAGQGPGGSEAVTATFVVRCLFSPFAHPLFTACTGVGVGIAVASRNWGVRIAAPTIGFVVAVGTHALWNAASLNGVGGFLGVYVVVMLPALLLMAALALWARSAEQRILYSALQDAADKGLFPVHDIEWIVDLRSRRRARLTARQMGGEREMNAMRQYQSAAVELAFLHHRYLKGTAPRDFSSRGEFYVSQLRAIRPQLSFGQAVQ